MEAGGEPKLWRWAVCGILPAVVLKLGLCLDTRHSPGQVSPTPPACTWRQGWLQRKECSLGAWRSGHIPGETPGLGAMFAQLRAQWRHPTDSLPSSSQLPANPQVGNPRGVVACTPPGVLARKKQAGKGCLRGVGQGELEGRGGPAGHLEMSLSNCAKSA